MSTRAQNLLRVGVPLSHYTFHIYTLLGAVKIPHILKVLHTKSTQLCAFTQQLYFILQLKKKKNPTDHADARMAIDFTKENEAASLTILFWFWLQQLTYLQVNSINQ